jgi:hypothetical protein
MKRATAMLLVLSMLTPSIALAVDAKRAEYVGGTAASFKDAKDPIEGVIDTSRSDALHFAGRDKPFKGTALDIPYANIIDLEYGQKAGRRVGAAIGTAVLLGPLGLFTLFSKKRKHYLTVGYKDNAGTDQVAIFELGKDIVRTSLKVIETRSGKSVEFQDEESRKYGYGGR